MFEINQIEKVADFMKYYVKVDVPFIHLKAKQLIIEE